MAAVRLGGLAPARPIIYIHVYYIYRDSARQTDTQTDRPTEKLTDYYNNPSLRMCARGLIGASVSEPPLVIVDSTDALSRYIYI